LIFEITNKTNRVIKRIAIHTTCGELVGITSNTCSIFGDIISLFAHGALSEISKGVAIGVKGGIDETVLSIEIEVETFLTFLTQGITRVVLTVRDFAIDLGANRKVIRVETFQTSITLKGLRVLEIDGLIGDEILETKHVSGVEGAVAILIQVWVIGRASCTGVLVRVGCTVLHSHEFTGIVNEHVSWVTLIACDGVRVMHTVLHDNTGCETLGIILKS
jgi:hypothetical protein